MLEVHPGGYDRRSSLVQVERIRFVQLRETAAARLLGLGAVYLHAAGGDPSAGKPPAGVPVVRARHLRSYYQGLLPEFQPGPVTVRPAAGSLLRYIGPALAAMAGGSGWEAGCWGRAGANGNP